MNIKTIIILFILITDVITNIITNIITNLLREEQAATAKEQGHR